MTPLPATYVALLNLGCRREERIERILMSFWEQKQGPVEVL